MGIFHLKNGNFSLKNGNILFEKWDFYTSKNWNPTLKTEIFDIKNGNLTFKKKRKFSLQKTGITPEKLESYTLKFITNKMRIKTKKLLIYNNQ